MIERLESSIKALTTDQYGYFTSAKYDYPNKIDTDRSIEYFEDSLRKFKDSDEERVSFQIDTIIRFLEINGKVNEQTYSQILNNIQSQRTKQAFVFLLASRAIRTQAWADRVKQIVDWDYVDMGAFLRTPTVYRRAMSGFLPTGMDHESSA